MINILRWALKIMLAFAGVSSLGATLLVAYMLYKAKVEDVVPGPLSRREILIFLMLVLGPPLLAAVLIKLALAL